MREFKKILKNSDDSGGTDRLEGTSLEDTFKEINGHGSKTRRNLTKTSRLALLGLLGITSTFLVTPCKACKPNSVASTY